MPRYQTILVPVDFSEGSQAALRAAVDLAKLNEGEIHLLHAYPIPFTLGVPYGVTLPDTVLTALRDASAEELDKLGGEVEADGVKCQRHLESASAVDAIIDRAEGLSADLIVMGTHGHTGLKRAVLGSVAERVVRNARCPVMTVKGEES